MPMAALQLLAVHAANRVPEIGHACEEPGWAPTTSMSDALRPVLGACRSQVASARELLS